MAQIEWLGHASFRLRNGATVYIDPWKLKADEPKADVILVSHTHYDHLSIEDIEKIRTPQTRILGSMDCADKIAPPLIGARPGEAHTLAGVAVRTLPAYNINKEFHPRANDWLGFIITLGGETIYYVGDSDLIPEMADAGRVDTALIPVGGTYTMTAAEGAQAAERIGARRVIPYHWGDIVGTRADAEAFVRACPSTAEILEISR
ncbi:MAG TPA: MBL fold metallo-hydrolase [Candidatus Sumerlaeota bacterium]|nr:MBL fold metallo-hydrolase [Candidatus Sumerlaeota bacterium]